MPIPPALNAALTVVFASSAALLIFSRSLVEAGSWIHAVIFAFYVAVCLVLYRLARRNYALGKASIASCVALLASLAAYFWAHALGLTSYFGLPAEYPRVIRVVALFLYPLPAVVATAAAALVPASLLSQASRAWMFVLSAVLIFAISSNGLFEPDLPPLRLAIRWVDFLYFAVGVAPLVLWYAPKLRRLVLNAA